MADVEKNTAVGITASQADGWVSSAENGSGSSISDDETLVGGTASDAKDMRRMGKVQELRRNFQTLSAIGFACCAMGTWEITYLQNTQALIDGGRSGLFWSQLWVYIGQTFIVLSLAEMASMAPTAGGQYHWVSEFAPPGAQRILSYVSGWMSMLAWQLFIAADTSLVANLVLALVAINNSDFVVKPYMDTLLIIATVLIVGAFNVFGVKLFPKFEAVFVFLHIAGFFAVIGVLWRYGTRSTAQEVFLDFEDNNEPGMNWPAIGITLLVGQAPAFFNVQGSDSVAHISEEVRDAGMAVPRAMLTAFCANIPFTFGILVTYIFTIGDVSKAISSPTGFPLIQPLQDHLSTAGTTGIVFLMFLLMFMITIGTTAATARQTFAFARDGGVPFSTWVAKVEPRLQVPANAVIVTAGFTTIMSLIYLGSSTAFNALVSTSVIGLMTTYFISIGCVLVRRIRAARSTGPPLPPARWSLGNRAGPVINVLAMAFCLEGFFWCFWPISNTTVPSLFNWGVVIYGAVILLATLQYVLVARHSYEGPVAKVRSD